MRLLLIFILSAFSVQVRAQAPAPLKEWTILVFLNADNNLYKFGLQNIAQMERVGSTADVDVVVEFDPQPSNLPTQRLHIQKSVNGKSASEILSTAPETDMGDWKHLAEFVTWGIQKYPAKHYALVLWNHGAGWRGISFDDRPSTHISVPDVSKALRQARLNLASQPAVRARGTAPLIDLLNFDACLMSTLETAYELRDSARVLVGSQYNEPGAGENYESILKRLNADSKKGVREFAEILVNDYVTEYHDATEINYLAVDTSRMASFTQVFRAAAAQHVAAPASVQKEIHDYYLYDLEGSDLIGGLTGALEKTTTDSPLAKSIDQVIRAYGYPAETLKDHLSPQGFRIVRRFPGVVFSRASMNGPVSRTVLTSQGNGEYAAMIPARPWQYSVHRWAGGREEARANEAVTTLVRGGDRPIVFHNQFPETSPVIADAHTLYTKGARGMSLYFNSLSRASKDEGRRIVPEITAEYTALDFARTGAPEWTRFMGM